ncbi:Calx-beta domain-containing protein, partial [Limimaricola pyoseonensis]
MTTVSISPAANTESSLNYLIFVVSLSEAAADAVSFNYRTLAGTAEDEDLYHGLNSSATSGRLSFAPGETTKEIAIRISGDSLDERDESVVMQLSELTPNASFAGG